MKNLIIYLFVIIAIVMLLEHIIIAQVSVYRIFKNSRYLNKNVDNNTIYDKYTLEHILFGDSYFNKVGKSYDEIFKSLLNSGITDDDTIDSLIEQVKDRRDSVKVSSLPSVIIAIISAISTVVVALSRKEIVGEFRTLLSLSLPLLIFALIGASSFIIFKAIYQPYDMVALNALYAYKRYIKVTRSK